MINGILDIIGSALDAQQLRQAVIVENLANAQTTKSTDGNAYQRKDTVFESYLSSATGPGNIPLQGVRVSSITTDSSAGERVYDPQHPHADATGMVTMPNVSVATEMANLVSASHAYESILAAANSTVESSKKALSIGNAI